MVNEYGHEMILAIVLLLIFIFSFVLLKHGGITRTGELLINPTSLIAFALRDYCQAIVCLLSFNRVSPLNYVINGPVKLRCLVQAGPGLVPNISLYLNERLLISGM